MSFSVGGFLALGSSVRRTVLIGVLENSPSVGLILKFPDSATPSQSLFLFLSRVRVSPASLRGRRWRPPELVELAD